MKSLSEYEDCIKVMRSDATISKHVDCLVGTWDFPSPETEWRYLSHFLIKLLPHLQKRNGFELEVFNHLYSDLEQFFYSDSVELRAFSPLLNFRSDVNEITLEEGLRIRKITKSELEQLMDEAMQHFQIPYFDVFHAKYAMEFTYQTKKIFGKSQGDEKHSPNLYANTIFNRLITALRLFKPGVIGFNIIKTIPMLDVPPLTETILSS